MRLGRMLSVGEVVEQTPVEEPAEQEMDGRRVDAVHAGPETTRESTGTAPDRVEVARPVATHADH